MRLRFSRQAVADARAALAWWKANRPSAPELLTHELAQARAILAATPRAGAPSLRPGRESIRRFVLRRTRYLVYYEVDEAAGVVTVLRLWHASRGASPQL